MHTITQVSIFEYLFFHQMNKTHFVFIRITDDKHCSTNIILYSDYNSCDSVVILSKIMVYTLRHYGTYILICYY